MFHIVYMLESCWGSCESQRQRETGKQTYLRRRQIQILSIDVDCVGLAWQGIIINTWIISSNNQLCLQCHAYYITKI